MRAKVNKAGRPKVSKIEYKGKLVGARFSNDEVKEIVSAAKRECVNKSQFVRKHLLNAARYDNV